LDQGRSQPRLGGERPCSQRELARLGHRVGAAQDRDRASAELAADPGRAPDADEPADDLALTLEALAERSLGLHAIEPHRSSAQKFKTVVIGQLLQRAGGDEDIGRQVGRQLAPGLADQRANPLVADRADPAADEVAERLQPVLGQQLVVDVGITARDSVDQPADDTLVPAEPDECAGEGRHGGNLGIGSGRPADLDAAKHAQLDAQPLADQLAIRIELEPVEHPANSLAVLGLEGRDHRGKGTGILGQPCDGVRLRCEARRSCLRRARVKHVRISL